MKKSTQKRIFLDFASTTPVLPEALQAMSPYFSKYFANPSALYSEGVAMKKVLNEQRNVVATLLQVHHDEIVFTGNGTEADNLALIGIVSEAKKNIQNPHVVVSAIEHPAILEMIERLKTDGAEVSVVYPKEDGVIDPRDVEVALKNNTVLVSIMYANNEIGTIQPIREIAKVIRHFKKNKKKSIHELYFHTDASQAANYLHIGVPQLGVDLMTLDGSKIYGPKGIGMLYVRRGIVITPQLLGGGQERGLRSGTEFVSGIVGFTKALSIVQGDKDKESKRLRVLQEKIITFLSKEFPHAILNGSRNERLPNNINICFPGIDGEFAVLTLDAHGIAVSSSSSCRTLADTSRSYVIDALYGKKNNHKKIDSVQNAIRNDCAESSLRMTLGRYTTKADVQTLISILKKKKSVFII